MDLLKKTHKNSESTYIKQDVFKAMFFNNEQLDAGTSNRKKTPIKGASNIKCVKEQNTNSESTFKISELIQEIKNMMVLISRTINKIAIR